MTFTTHATTDRTVVLSADELNEGDYAHVINEANGSAEVQGEVLAVNEEENTFTVSICGVRKKTVAFNPDGTATVPGAVWSFRVKVE